MVTLLLYIGTMTRIKIIILNFVHEVHLRTDFLFYTAQEETVSMITTITALKYILKVICCPNDTIFKFHLEKHLWP